MPSSKVSHWLVVGRVQVKNGLSTYVHSQDLKDEVGQAWVDAVEQHEEPVQTSSEQLVPTLTNRDTERDPQSSNAQQNADKNG